MRVARAWLEASTGPLLEGLRKGETARVVVGPPPTPNRKAFPYQGTIDFQGMRILVENLKGSTRSGKDPGGKPWSVTMTAPYGEFEGTLGTDGDPVDVFVGPNALAPMAYVIHRKWPGTEVFDEDKAVVGCNTAEEAEALFRANYNEPGQLQGVTPWPVEELRAYLASDEHEGKRLDTPRRVRLLLRKSIRRERLRGGLADGRDPRTFDQEQLAEGQRHELEHTEDEDTAREIAMDHLAEDPDYYRKLEELEKAGVGSVKGKAGLHLDAQKHRWVHDETGPHPYAGREHMVYPDRTSTRRQAPGVIMDPRAAAIVGATGGARVAIPAEAGVHDTPLGDLAGIVADPLDAVKVDGLKVALAGGAKVPPLLLEVSHTGRVQLIDGHHRLAAARAAGVASLPVRWYLRKGGTLLRLLKATIRTPTGADGKVDYDAVPVGASIWVRVTAESSPLHGRPILLTKRPDHQFALTGGSGAKHIQARRHLVVSGGKAKTTERDEAALKARQEAEERNAPARARVKELRKQARVEQGKAEDAFMEALGIKKRGLTKAEKAEVHEAARRHAEADGLTGRDAEAFAGHMANGIARKEREFRLQQAAHRLELARHIARGADPDEAAAVVGPAPTPTAYTAPELEPEAWAAMTEPEREAHVQSHLDQQDTRRVLEEAEADRFEPETRAELEEQAPAPTVAPEGHDLEHTPTTAGAETAPSDPEHPAAQPAEPTVERADLETADAYAGGASPAELPAPPPPETIGESPGVGEQFPVGHDEPPAPGAAPEKPARAILSREAAEKALEHFRAYAGARKAEREASGGLEKLADQESATPAAVEDLRLRVGAVDDDELGRFLDEYRQSNGGPPDTGFYDAMSPHWNDHVGNKLAGAVTRGAASAITGLVGDEIGARFDVQRLVDALGPEAASMAVVHRMREELGDGFGAWVEKLRDHNATNQRVTEKKALTRHLELQKQAEDLEKQVRSGDLRSVASVEVLRARNLLEQRENLGGALGSLQASAALYHFADAAKGERYRKQDVTINVGSKVALADKLKRLGKVKATTGYHPALGYQIHTDTDALRKYVGRTESNRSDAERWRAVKYDTTGVKHDDEGREWVPDYKVPGFRSHFGAAEELPIDQRHLAGKPIQLLADQRNNIEWLHGSGGGLVTMRTGGGKTVTSIGVAGKMLHENPKGRHLRIVPDGREEQWAAEVRNFSTIPPVVLPASSTKDERARTLASAPEGAVVIVGHTNAGRYDHEALATTHAWDSIGIDEPQELRARSGSGKMGAGAKRIFKIPARNRHALTATPATDHPVEAYDIVNWTKPGALGYRSRFRRAFDGFGGGTNAQDAALERMLYQELEPHVSGERLVSPHYGIQHNDVRVSMSGSQLERQRGIEERVDATIAAAVDDAKAKKQAGVRGYAERSYAALNREAREKAMAKLEGEHRGNLSGGDIEHNPKLAAMQKAIGASDPSHRHVIFVDSADQRRSVTSMLERMGHKGKVKNITASAKGDTVKRGGVEVAAIEERKRDWKGTEGGFLVIDRSSASGHNLAEGDHLHVLGNPDDAAQMLQAHGRLGRANRVGDFAIHTYRYDDSPFEHHHWNRLERQLKVLRATAPGMFVEGKPHAPAAAMAKSAQPGRFRLLLRRIMGAS